jgi:putative IMPACT (imprinted ancient) family translation regulator
MIWTLSIKETDSEFRNVLSCTQDYKAARETIEEREKVQYNATDRLSAAGNAYLNLKENQD